MLLLDVPDPTAASLLDLQMQVSGEVIEPGEQVKVKITNTQAPNSRDANDPMRILNVSVLVLSSDWSVTQLYPVAASFEPVDPGKSIDLEFEAYLPDGETESRDTFKVFATRGTTDFRWLELPALDQPPIQRSATRAVISDPLEQMLAGVISDEQRATRAVRLTKSSSPKRSWTTSKVEFRVRKAT